MLTIQLKARHLFLIAELLTTQNIYGYLRLINSVKENIAIQYDGNDEGVIQVQATTNEVVDIFNILSSLPEGQSATINLEIFASLYPQLLTGLASEDPDWTYIYNYIIEGRNRNKGIMDRRVADGKAFLGL